MIMATYVYKCDTCDTTRTDKSSIHDYVSRVGDACGCGGLLKRLFRDEKAGIHWRDGQDPSGD